MKVMSYGAATARETDDALRHDQVDITSCTRCGESWGYEIVEQVELWSCSRCGYEVRERSADHDAMLDAKQESMAG